MLALRALKARGAVTELRGSLLATPTIETNVTTGGCKEEEEDESNSHHQKGKHAIPVTCPIP